MLCSPRDGWSLPVRPVAVVVLVATGLRGREAVGLKLLRSQGTLWSRYDRHRFPQSQIPVPSLLGAQPQATLVSTANRSEDIPVLAHLAPFLVRLHENRTDHPPLIPASCTWQTTALPSQTHLRFPALWELQSTELSSGVWKFLPHPSLLDLKTEPFKRVTLHLLCKSNTPTAQAGITWHAFC